MPRGSCACAWPMPAAMRMRIARPGSRIARHARCSARHRWTPTTRSHARSDATRAER
ncbi:hypothetical protein DB32_000866 [Sandaracinus amylolyticus]|uniref:Uncharacterized protein n=1 Tax=Sandaracinus amylolyticus TaxID=927083 RepID=A0A0F6VZN8_9BACT|nr:hypothetical protein DB32_000866 [Sandaracinus amylolyticus]